MEEFLQRECPLRPTIRAGILFPDNKLKQKTRLCQEGLRQPR
jgi:hypothetical protein